MVIQESAENYLEAILVLQQKNGVVRAIDVASMLNFSKPSVSVAMKNFRENGYIDVSFNGHITLTDKGREIAEKTYSRHNLIKEILVMIGVSEKSAAEDACRLEHGICEETYEKLQEIYFKMKNNGK